MTTDVQKIKKDTYDQDEQVIVPPVDIYETENEYVVKADMPGINKENVEITLENNLLEIIGVVKNDEKNAKDIKYREYSMYNYYRTFNVGNDIDSNHITANMDSGVLTLILSKREEVKPKRIEISVEK